MFEVQSLVRSSVDSARDDLCERIDSLFSLGGRKVISTAVIRAGPPTRTHRYLTS